MLANNKTTSDEDRATVQKMSILQKEVQLRHVILLLISFVYRLFELSPSSPPYVSLYLLPGSLDSKRHHQTRDDRLSWGYT